VVRARRRVRRRDGAVLGGSRLVRATIWGCRGALASPGPDTVRYGGNTACVETRLSEQSLLVPDAPTRLPPFGSQLLSACAAGGRVSDHGGGSGRGVRAGSRAGPWRGGPVDGVAGVGVGGRRGVGRRRPVPRLAVHRRRVRVAGRMGTLDDAPRRAVRAAGEG